jgi:hypothetical protein
MAVDVPGQAANQVVAVPQGSPAGSEANIGSSNASDPYGDRIQQGFDAAAQQPATSQTLTDALTGGGNDTSTIDSALQALTAGSTTGTADGEPADRGWLGNMLPEGVSNFAADAATGLAYADPRQPASMAFGKGFAGAQASNRARVDRKRADQREARQEQEHKEDRAYQRNRDKVGDLRTAASDERQMLAYADAKERQDRLDALAKPGIELENAVGAEKFKELMRSMNDAGYMTREEQASINHDILVEVDRMEKAAADSYSAEPFDRRKAAEAALDTILQTRKALLGQSEDASGGTSAAAKGDLRAGTAAPGEVTVDSATAPAAADSAAAAEQPKAGAGTSRENALVIPHGADPRIYVPQMAKQLGLSTVIFKTEDGGFNVWP